MKSECKIGLLYVKHGQKTEEEIFSNTSHSPAFETFLRLLGDHVTLKGFTGYSGGLDTSNGLNGSQSVYTTYQHNKIMFHVSTLMPNTSGDLKHVRFCWRHLAVRNSVIEFAFKFENCLLLCVVLLLIFMYCCIVLLISYLIRLPDRFARTFLNA